MRSPSFLREKKCSYSKQIDTLVTTRDPLDVSLRTSD